MIKIPYACKGNFRTIYHVHVLLIKVMNDLSIKCKRNCETNSIKQDLCYVGILRERMGQFHIIMLRQVLAYVPTIKPG